MDEILKISKELTDKVMTDSEISDERKNIFLKALLGAQLMSDVITVDEFINAIKVKDDDIIFKNGKYLTDLSMILDSRGFKGEKAKKLIQSMHDSIDEIAKELGV